MMLANQPARSRPRKRWAYPTIVGAAIVVMIARIVPTYRVFSDTIDEPYHIGAAMGLIEARKHIHGVEHPPLPRLLVGIPLALSGVEVPESLGVKTVQQNVDAFKVGHHVLTKSTLGYWQVLTRARIPMLVFAALAIVYVYLLGRYVASPMVGCLAAVFFSTDSTLLGHGTWVATDVAAAGGFLAAIYHGVRWIGRDTWGRTFVAGAVFGLAVSCKFSCGLALPALAVIVLMRRPRAVRRWRWKSYWRAWPTPGKVLAAAVCALVTLWATYLFDVGRIGDCVAMKGYWRWEAIPDWVKQLRVPMPSAVIGYMELSRHNMMGHTAYLNGQVSDGGWWWYFPEALAIKSPAALVVGLIAAVALVLLCRPALARRSGVVIVPAAIFLLVCMGARLNIGVRHVLPVIPLLYLFVVQQLSRLRMGIVCVPLIVLAAIETALVHPDYIAFFNALVGGPRAGEQFLLDSNLDWGQDEARLAEWFRRHARGRTVTGRLFTNARLWQWPAEGYELLPAPAPPAGLVAVSKNCLYGLYPPYILQSDGSMTAGAGVEWMNNLEPVASIGRSILVYDLGEPR